MWGAIAGDIIGSVYERHNTNRYDFELFTEHSTFTDDTVLTVAVMDHILRRTDLAETLRSWCNRYPDRGYGPGFLAWVGGHGSGHSRGNGAAMRVSPFAWWWKKPADILEKADEQARLTHDSNEGRNAAKAVALAVHSARYGLIKRCMVRALNQYYALSEEWPPAIRKPGALAKESVPVALQAVISSSGFEDAIRKAVSIGGDSDTIASIAGAVAEAWYGGVKKGMPPKILHEVRKRLPEEMVAVVEAFRRQIDPSRMKDGHPFKSGTILFGFRPPHAWIDRQEQLREQTKTPQAQERGDEKADWIPCAFATMVIRGAALAAFPGGADVFAEKYKCRHGSNIVVACSMGGDRYLDNILEAAERAGVDLQQDMFCFDAFRLALAPREFFPQPDGPLDFAQQWLEGKLQGGRVMVRGKPVGL